MLNVRRQASLEVLRQEPVVQKVDNAIHRINLPPVNNRLVALIYLFAG